MLQNHHGGRSQWHQNNRNRSVSESQTGTFANASVSFVRNDDYSRTRRMSASTSGRQR